MLAIAMIAATALIAIDVIGVDLAAAQESGPGFLDNLFGRSPSGADRVAQDRSGQADPADVVLRLNRLEAQIRQLTGTIEQLQIRNQQLEGQLRRVLEEGDHVRTGTPVVDPSRPSGAPSLPPPGTRPPATAAPVTTPAVPGRRGDAFDPAQSPNAPGAPRVLGSISETAPASAPMTAPPAAVPEAPPVGAPGGRAAGAPLDLSTLAARAGVDPALPAAGALPPERGARDSGTQIATAPPSDSPKDNYDLAYGYVLRKDYALAEDGFRTFLQKYPSDRMAPEAQYWLGESLFQRQRYRDAAEAFLNVSTKFDTSAKAPDALLRLGQSLAALEEKEAACAALGEVSRKYPRAAVSVKQGVEREQKRVHC